MRNKLLVTLFSAGTLCAGHDALATKNPVTLAKQIPGKVSATMQRVKQAVKSPFLKAKTSVSGFYDRVKSGANRVAHPFAKVSQAEAAGVIKQMSESGGKPSAESVTILAKLMGEKDPRKFAERASTDEGYRTKMQERLIKAAGGRPQVAQAQ